MSTKESTALAREMGLTVEQYFELGMTIRDELRASLEKTLRELEPKTTGELIILNLAIGIVQGKLG